MIRDVFVFRELGKVCCFDIEPVLGPPLCGVAQLLFFGHVWPTNPVLVLCLPLQMCQGVALHLPGNLSWTPVLSNPLLARDAFPQHGGSEEHDGAVLLEGKERSDSEFIRHVYMQFICFIGGKKTHEINLIYGNSLFFTQVAALFVKVVLKKKLPN